MASPPKPVAEQRRDQMFPDLEPFEIERMRRFGECRTFQPGDKLFTAGEIGPGLVVIPCGKVEISQTDSSGNRRLIVTHGPGQFLGELAQMAGRPSLADATAIEPVHGIIIQPDRLRAHGQHRSRDRRRGERARRPQRCAGSGTLAPWQKRQRDAASDRSSVPVHRRGAEYRLACRFRRQAGRQRLRADWRGSRRRPSCAGNQPRGVFAIGDVRAGSIKRVAAAVGEGAQVVAALHGYLAETAGKPPTLAVMVTNPSAPVQTH